MSDLRVHLVDHPDQWVGIQALQRANLRRTVGEQEAAREGFVTAEYTLAFLEAMHHAAPSIVATERGAVVGYALVSERSVALTHPLLRDLFEAADRLVWNGEPLARRSYVVCGQLCVARSHRGLGLVDRLYGTFRDVYAERYAYLVTDVADDNPRSLRAHERVGFTTLAAKSYGGIGWRIVLWDWRRAVPR